MQDQSKIKWSDLQPLESTKSGGIQTPFQELNKKFKEKYGIDLEITGTETEIHKKLHGSGNAFDIRSRNLNIEQRGFIQSLASELGIDAHDYTDSWQKIKGTGPHIHMNVVKNNGRSTVKWDSLVEEKPNDPLESLQYLNLQSIGQTPPKKQLKKKSDISVPSNLVVSGSIVTLPGVGQVNITSPNQTPVERIEDRGKKGKVRLTRIAEVLPTKKEQLSKLEESSQMSGPVQVGPDWFPYTMNAVENPSVVEGIGSMLDNPVTRSFNAISTLLSGTSRGLLSDANVRIGEENYSAKSVLEAAAQSFYTGQTPEQYKWITGAAVKEAAKALEIDPNNEVVQIIANTLDLAVDPTTWISGHHITNKLPGGRQLSKWEELKSITKEAQPGFEKPKLSLKEFQELYGKQEPIPASQINPQPVSQPITPLPSSGLLISQKLESLGYSQSEISKMTLKEATQKSIPESIPESFIGYRLKGESIEDYYERIMKQTPRDRRVGFEEFKREYDRSLAESYGPEPGDTSYYHGSPTSNLTEINPSPGDYGYGIYFTSDRELAKHYSKGRKEVAKYIYGERADEPLEGTIYNISPQLKNPLKITNEEQYNKLLSKYGDSDKTLAEWARKQGYDGILNDVNNEHILFSENPIRINKNLTDIEQQLGKGSQARIPDEELREKGFIAGDIKNLIPEEKPRLIPKPEIKPEPGIRSFPKTLRENQVIDMEDMSYDIISNKQTWDNAQKIVDEKGIDGAIEFVKSQEIPSSDSVATGIKLIDDLVKKGDPRASDVAQELSVQLTKAGQAVQAASIASRLGPENTLLTAQRILNKRGRGEKLTPLQTKEIYDLATEIKQVQDRLKELKQQAKVEGVDITTPKPKKGEEWIQKLDQRANEAKLRIQERLRVERGSGGPSTEQLEDIAIYLASKAAKGTIQVAQYIDELADEFGDWVRESQGRIIERATQIIKDERSAQYQLGKQKRLEKNLSQTTYSEMKDITQLEKTSRDLSLKLGKQFKKLDPGTYVGKLVGDINNASRSILSSFDVSAPGRQGMWFNITHPSTFKDSFVNQFKTLFKNREDFIKWEDNFKSSKGYDEALESGVQFTHTHSEDILAPQQYFEEPFQTSVASLPGIRHSEQAYTSYLNTQRLAAFNIGKELLESQSKTLISHPHEYKALARYVNVATGRADLGTKLNNLASLGVFFAPRYKISRFQLLNPMFYYNLTKQSPTVGKMAMKDAAKFTVFWGGLVGLTKLTSDVTGFESSFDPTNTDFGKVRIGNTTYDFSGGLQTELRLMMNLSKASIERDGDRFKDLIWNFTRSNLGPLPGTTVDAATGTTLEYDVEGNKKPFRFYNKPYDNLLVDKAVPLFVQDLIKSFEAEQHASGSGIKGSLKTLPSGLGIGTQTFQKKKPYSKEQKEFFKKNKEIQKERKTLLKRAS